MQRVLILNASHNEERMIRALKEMNFYVISTGNRPNLPGHKLCDEYHPADYSDKDCILNMAVDLKVDRICACVNDFGVSTAAYVAEKLGISGYDCYETILTLHNKDRFKAFACEHDIDTPPAVQFLSKESAENFSKMADYPIIVKAVDLSAGNGIRKANNFDEALIAIENAFKCSRIKHIVIEPYINGNQHGFCTFLINKKVVAYCSNDEYSIVNPYRVEIDTFPATDESQVEKYLISQIEKMANILDLCDGCFHLQYITDEKKHPHIIECMRRLPGGLYTIPAESVSGINWDYWEARAKCTNNLQDFPVFNHLNRGYFSYKCIMANENGRIKNITLSEELKRHRYDELWIEKTGNIIENYQSTPISYIFTSYSSQMEMKSVLIDNYAETKVAIEK